MKIVIADDMEPEVVENIKKFGEVEYKPADLQKALADAEVLIVRSRTQVTGELISGAGKLKLVARAGVGLDNIDVQACEARGIKVINTPNASSPAVAELAIGLMICGLRNVVKANIALLQGNFDKKAMTGREIGGKTLGIIGYGRIGREVAKRALALGMKVIAYDPYVKEAEPGVRLVSLDELLATSDIVSLHVALTPETKGLINAQAIAKMKKTAYLINLARGAVVDEAALIAALKEGRIAGAALDVTVREPPTGELLNTPNLILTGHLGASTKEAQARIGEELIRQLNEFFKGGAG
ncbi:MAG: hydroxyacid dehydrogenase [Candidatus Micrarchaeia archaeon]